MFYNIFSWRNQDTLPFLDHTFLFHRFTRSSSRERRRTVFRVQFLVHVVKRMDEAMPCPGAALRPGRWTDEVGTKYPEWSLFVELESVGSGRLRRWQEERQHGRWAKKRPPQVSWHTAQSLLATGQPNLSGKTQRSQLPSAIAKDHRRWSQVNVGWLTWNRMCSVILHHWHQLMSLTQCDELSCFSWLFFPKYLNTRRMNK